jgi:hypothetical protein
VRPAIVSKPCKLPQATQFALALQGERDRDLLGDLRLVESDLLRPKGAPFRSLPRFEVTLR